MHKALRCRSILPLDLRLDHKRSSSHCVLAERLLDTMAWTRVDPTIMVTVW